MNMKKIILTLLLVLCCGCKAKYQLIFEEDKIYEKLDITYPRNNESNEELNSIYTNHLYAIDRSSFYKFNNNSTEENVKLNFNYEYMGKKITSSNLIKTCIEHFDFFEEDNKYYLIGTGAFKCSFYEYIKLESLDISISTNHNVLENNANEVKNGEYIWHIDLNNLENINIKFITDNKENKQIKQADFKKTIIVICAISLAALLMIITIFIRYKRVNKI